jgi:DNA-directed RNA polymerase subunit RPC12/RpoP
MHIRQLMDDPIYRAYLKQAPQESPIATQSPAWQLWVRTPDNRWLTRQYGSYRDAWPVFVARYRAGDDPTIVARRKFYAPPGEWYKVRVRKQRKPTPSDPSTSFVKIEDRWRQLFFWDDPFLEWCARCRRPVRFQSLFETHHALSRWPVVSDEDNMRCPVCGIRRSALPSSFDQMIRP